MDAMQYVRQQITAPGVNLSDVAAGAGVGYSWIKMFARGDIPDPGYSRVKALADYFLRTGKPAAPESSPQEAA